MRHSSWREDGIAWSQRVPLVADLDHVFALDYVEPLLLFIVEMSRGSTLAVVCELDDKEITVRVQARHLEVDHPGAEHLALLLESIATGRDADALIE
jgi:hypothetical protein